MEINAELSKIVDHDIPESDRIKVINDLTSSMNIDLIFPLANIGMLNTLPDVILSALGESIGRLIIVGNLSIDDEAAKEMLGFLQPTTRQAVMLRLAEAGIEDNIKDHSTKDINLIGSY